MSTRKATPDPLAPLDHRAVNRRLAGRERMERLMRLARHLPPADRALLQQAWERRMSNRELGQLLQRHPATIRRRLARIITRLRDRRFVYLATHAHRFEPQNLRVAQQITYAGQSLRQAAQHTGVSIHQARQVHRELTIRASG